MFRRQTRTPYWACIAAVLALLVPAWAYAQTDQTREAPLVPPPADGVALFGELVSIGPDYIVLRETTYAWAPDAKAGDQPIATVAERVIKILEGASITYSGEGGLEPGVRVFVGARMVDGVMSAVAIHDVAKLGGGQVTDPEAFRAALREPIREALSTGTVGAPERLDAGLNCLSVNGFKPDATTLDFRGCFGAPSFTASASFSPVKLFSAVDPFSVEVFYIAVSRFDVNLQLTGYNYQFPFKFSAEDPAQVAIDTWARTCLADYGSVEVGVCPLVRPWVPAPNQARNIRVNVAPVDPSPAPTMNGGLGGALAFEFVFWFKTGCGPTKLDPCTFKTMFDFGPFSQSTRAQGPPPVRPAGISYVPGYFIGQATPPSTSPGVLRGEAVSCLAYGGSLILGVLGVPIILNTLISPFDLLFCQPFELYNSSYPGFNAKVTDARGGRLSDLAGTDNPRVSFNGNPVSMRLTPGPSGSSLIRFQQFDYRLDWLSKVRLDLRSSFVTWFRGTEWTLEYRTGSPFVYSANAEFIGGPDGCNGTHYSASTDIYGFSRSMPLCIEIPIPEAAFGNATISEFSPVAVSSLGGTVVRVVGKGFNPTKQANGAPYPGTGVTRVVLHRADNTQVDVPFRIRSNGELELTMPAHPPTLLTDSDGYIESFNSLGLTFYAWGTTIPKSIFYAARPAISQLTVLDYPGPVPEHATGSNRGGERVLITGNRTGWITGVYFGTQRASFAECFPGQTNPLCAGVSGGGGYSSRVVALVPAGMGEIADCPTGAGTRCDYVRITSFCFGDGLVTGRPAPGVYCGDSLDDPAALYVRKTMPEITSLTPASGPPGTNVQITINGVGFLGVPTVRIGNTTIGPICNLAGCPGSGPFLDTQLVVTVPAAAVGTSQVTVTNPCPGYFTSRCGESFSRSFRHLDAPRITALSPSQGTHAGGTEVTVTGLGFTTATSVTLGGLNMAFTLDGTTPDTKLRFTTPRGYPDIVSGLPASLDVVVTVACGTVSTSNATACGATGPASFTYQPPEFRLGSWLQIQPITGEVGRPAPLSATLRTFEDVPLPGRTISFKILGQTVASAVTNASGVAATTAVMPALPTGVYSEQAVAVFGGDDVYLPRQSVGYFVLTHAEVVAFGVPFFPSYINVPVLLQSVKSISAGGNHTLALKHDGTVVGWGNTNPIYGAFPPAGLNNVVAISAGYAHSLALRSDNTVVQWGTGGTLPALPPIQVISAGEGVSVAITTAGDLVAWGTNPSNPVLSNIPVAGGDPFIAVQAGQSHAIALRQSGTVVAWGTSSNGSTTVPAGLTNVVAIAANWLGNLALKSDGTVVAWGASCVPYGCGAIGSYLKPPPDLSGVQAIDLSQSFAPYGIAKKADGTLVSWALGAYRSLGAPAGYDVNVDSISTGGENGAPFTVVLRKPRLDTSVTVDPVTGFAGDAVTLRALLLTGNSTIELQDVSFTIGGVSAGTGKTGTGALTGVATKAATIPARSPGVYPTGVQGAFPTPALGLVSSSGSAQLLVRGNQTLTFDSLSDRFFSPVPFAVSAGSTAPLPVSFTASGACSVAGNMVTMTGLGTCTVTAAQPGDIVYTAAASVPRSFEVARTPQTISFEPLPNVPFGAATKRVDASATSGLPVVLTSLTPAVCSAVGMRVTSLKVGVCGVAADQPGSANYHPAPRVVRSFAITLDAFDLSRLPSQLDPPSGQLAAGFFHTCALSATGGVKCWGNNAFGQLGDGSTTRRLLPVDVSGLGSQAVILAAGGNHTCAVMSGGGVACWGSNANGELGDNSTTAASTPVTVSGLSGVVGLAAGASHTCALTTAGRVKCWGMNTSGQLGNNSTAQSLLPTDVSGPGGTGLLSSVVTIASGAYSTCAVSASGGVHCWGAANEGQLGSGSTTFSSTPVVVVGPGGTGVLSGVASIASGEYHTCAVTTAGVPYCWGRNSLGQLGDGTGTQSLAPVAVSSLPEGVTNLITGGNHTCAVTLSEGARCWGWNTSGQLGDGTTTTRLSPVPVPGLAYGLSKIVAGGNHTCALGTTGGVKCWGSNSDGQVGNNTTLSQSTFVDVPGLSAGVTQVSLSVSQGCALTPAGGVQCWGHNDQGQLGDGTTTNRSTPKDVVGLKSGVTAIASGGFHTCALTQDGGVKCWGWNPYGAIGDGTLVSKLVPTDVVGLTSGVARIAAGEYHTCAVLTDGNIKCWGSNAFGQLGDSSLVNRLSPVSITAPVSGVVSIIAGSNHNCVLTSEGAVKCWGRNANGQLGDGTTALRSTPPVDVVGLGGGVLGLGAGADHTCAFLDGGVTKCWGANTDGQLGDASQTARLTPVDLSTPVEGTSALALGGNNTCAMGTAGMVKCWGRNAAGQLGDGTTVARPEATFEVSGMAYGAGALGGADGHNCAITGAGGLKCWGNNQSGQVGDGTNVNRLVPVDVRGGQSIYLVVPPTIRKQQQLQIEAVATSGLPVTLESLTSRTCTVSATTLTGVSQGVCVVRATQFGNGSFATAPPQLRVIPVTGALYTVTASAGVNGSISPVGDVIVVEGASRQFTVVPYDEYAATVAGTCGGSLSGITYTTAPISGNCTVVATFAPVFISISDVTVTEGNTGARDAVFTVTLSAPSLYNVGVWAQIGNGSASAGSDYTSVGPSGILFSPGVTSKTFTVPVLGDTLDEDDETFVVDLTGPSNATLADAQGVGTITDDDASPSLSIDDVSVTEGDTGFVNATFTVSLSAISGRSVRVKAATSNGTATAGSDYASTGPSTLTIAAGQTTATFTVLTNGDALDEANETFTVMLTDPANAALSDDTGAGTITDDDDTPTLSINDVTVAEGNSGTVEAIFTVTLSAVSGREVRVKAQSQDDTAVAGEDYTAIGPTTITFDPGATSATFTVLVTGESAAESAETFTVNLTELENATVSDAQGVGTIVDDDGQTNSDPNRARALLVNSVARTVVHDGRPPVWYRARLFANRSYQISAWLVDHEEGVAAPVLSIAVFSDDAGNVPAAGVSSISGALEGSSNQGGDGKPATAIFEPPVTGVYKIRVQAEGGGGGAHSANLLLRETALFSSWTSRAAGFEGFIELHNNTNAPVQVTLRAFSSAGALQGAGLTLTVAPNATEFRTAGQIGVPAGSFAGIVLTHSGAFGTISGNVTTLNSANGLSFDSPFEVRHASLAAAPVR